MMKTLPLQISQALFRVCQFIKQKDLRSRIESYGVYLLESASASDFDSVDKAVAILEKFIFLGEEIGEIHYHHAQILHGQFSNLRKTVIEERERIRVEFAIADIFSGDFEKYSKKDRGTPENYEAELQKSGNDMDRQSGNKANAPVPAISNAAILRQAQDKFFGQANDKSGNGGTWAEERQELISQKIRQLEKAAMKDVVAAFPDVSERTLRYDLQKLCDKQIIERIGSGGPASFYQIKRQFIAQELVPSSSRELRPRVPILPPQS